MTTTTPSFTYRAQTDASTKTWHLGSDEKGELCVCGVRLMTPADVRKFAQKYPSDERVYTTSADLGAVTCRACQRTREWTTATGVPRPAATSPETSTIADAAARPSRRRGRRAVTGDPRADRAANAEAAGNAG